MFSPRTHPRMVGLSLAMASASLATPAAAQPSAPAPADPVNTVVIPMFEAVAREDLGAATRFLAEGAMLRAMFNPNGETGEGSVRTFPATAYFTLVARNYENIVFNNRTYSVADDGKTVWMEANGDLRLEANGSPYRNRYVFKITLNAQGKVTEIREWVNTVTLTQQGIAAN